MSVDLVWAYLLWRARREIARAMPPSLGEPDNDLRELRRNHLRQLASQVFGVQRVSHVTINEMTTVALVWTHAQFIDGVGIKGHALGLRIARLNKLSFADAAGSPSRSSLGIPSGGV